jgi:excisionase family DNA binding protein
MMGNDFVSVRRNEHIPLCIGWGVEGLNGVVELADEPSDLREVFSGVEQVEPVRPDDFTGDVGENFAPLIVQTQGAGGSGEADAMEVVEEGVNCCRPGTGGPSDGISDANYLVDVAAGHLLAGFVRHDQECHMCRPRQQQDEAARTVLASRDECWRPVRTSARAPDHREAIPLCAQTKGRMIMERLLSKVHEVAERLTVSRTKVYELVQSGALPSERIDRSRRVVTSSSTASD